MRGTTVNEADHPALWQFLGAYLHQDWRADYSDTREALSDFMTGEPTFAPNLASEIEHLLASTRPPGETEAAILALGSFFVPSSSGQDAREWLLLIRAEAARTLRAG
jgi:hypothetical protein